jgi:transposase
MHDMTKRPSPPKDSAVAIRAAAASERSKPAETPAQPSKRVYTPAYKARVLDELARVRQEGEKGAVGALFRREGLTWATVLRWEEARAQAGQAGLEPKTKGRPPKDGKDAVARKQAQENERLRKQNEKLQAELEKAKIIIEVQKKLSALLGIEVPTDPDKDGTP